MGKEYRRRCPDCDREDPDIIFGSKGDGRCSHCHGEGKTADFFIATVSEFLENMDPDAPCDICSKSGQCQTCGGTGYQYYNEENSNDDGTEEADTNYSRTSHSETLYSSDYSDASGYSSSPQNTSTKNVNEAVPVIIGFMVIIAIIAAIVNIISAIGSSQPPPQVYIQQQEQQPIVQHEVSPCESNNTGDFAFENKTSRTIYIYFSSIGLYSNWSKTITVEPSQTAQEYNIPVDKYHYKYSYYKQSDFLGYNEVGGNFFVEKCTSQSIELNLPAVDWYTLSESVWKEINIPPDCCYAVVTPYHQFSIRFFENDRVHIGSSFAFIPEGTTKIYLKSDYTKDSDLEVSIQKYNSSADR